VATWIVAAIADALNTEEPHFLIHTGDSSTARGDDNQWDVWGRMVERIATTVPHMITPGPNDAGAAFGTTGYINRFFVSRFYFHWHTF
jgi:hypothetical protein